MLTISTDMPHFFLKLIAPRPTFANDMNDAEKAMMQEHFLYWKGRQDKGDVWCSARSWIRKDPMEWAL
jgi:hypothetical protein